MRTLHLSLLLVFSQWSCASAPPSSAANSTTTAVPSNTANEADSTDADLGPLLWTVKSPDGLTSYILANGRDVSSRQLNPKVWEHFDQSKEVLFEMDGEAMVKWAMSQEWSLEDAMGADSFEDLLRTLPELPRSVMARLPIFVVAEELARPKRHPGPGMTDALLERAKEKEMTVDFLVQDTAGYLTAFAKVFPSLDELLEILANPKPATSLRKSQRRAYLRGDLEALDPRSYNTDQYIQVITEQNRSWMPKLEKAFARGNAFALISTTDLLSEKGVMTELRQRGFTITLALKGQPSSQRLDVPEFLEHAECHDLLLHIAKVTSPEAVDRLQDEEVARAVQISTEGREFMSNCLAQTTRWFDCVTDATDLKTMERCDLRHPAPN